MAKKVFWMAWTFDCLITARTLFNFNFQRRSPMLLRIINGKIAGIFVTN